MKKLILIALAIFATASLQAAIVTNTATTAMLDGGTSTIQLGKFNDSLGTLTGIYIEYWTALTGVRVQLDNDGIAGTGTGKALVTATEFASEARILSGTFSSGDLSIDESQAYSLDATTGDSTNEFNQTLLGDYADWNPESVSGIANGDVLDALGYFADYIGSGTYNVSVDTSYLVGGTFSGIGKALAESNGGTFNGKVIYTYTPIPEPATASLMAVVAGLAFLIRRHFVA